MTLLWKISVACPFFVPLEIVNDGSWPHPARLPLGAGWSGACCASGQEAAADAATGAPATSATLVAVDAAYIREFCNLGYATACPHLPRVRDWDAVRFSVASSSPQEIILCYVCELGHAPVEHGTLNYDLVDEAWRRVPQDPRVRRLAKSYLHAYRARKRGGVI